jgi:hypothetical protein
MAEAESAAEQLHANRLARKEAFREMATQRMNTR